VRVDDPSAVLECGGAPMLTMGSERPSGGSLAPGRDTGSLMGKRYGAAGTPVEVLCVKPGAGTLAVGGVVLENRVAKPLPASD
jgi:hypothetical protein